MVVYTIGYFAGQFLIILTFSVIITGVCHLFFTPQMTFGKVFLHVFILVLIMVILGQILPNR